MRHVYAIFWDEFVYGSGKVEVECRMCHSLGVYAKKDHAEKQAKNMTGEQANGAEEGGIIEYYVERLLVH